MNVAAPYTGAAALASYIAGSATLRLRHCDHQRAATKPPHSNTNTTGAVDNAKRGTSAKLIANGDQRRCSARSIRKAAPSSITGMNERGKSNVLSSTSAQTR